MFLDISKALQSPGVEFPFSLALALPPQQMEDESIEFPSPIALQGVYGAAGESVFVRGELTAEAHAACARCLVPVVHRVHARFDEVFVKEPDPKEPEQFAYAGSAIELTDLALSTVFLALPMRFLCREDCAGLCPVCGADLNEAETTCSCQKDMPERHPFSALQQMRTKDEEV